MTVVAEAAPPDVSSGEVSFIRERRKTGVGTNEGPEGHLRTPSVGLQSRQLPYLTHILSCRCSLLELRQVRIARPNQRHRS